MRVNLLNEGYKDNKEFYQAFLDDSLWQSSYVSEDYINIPEEIPDFRIYFANKDEEVRETEFIDTIKICAEYVIKLDRDIAMDECLRWDEPSNLIPAHLFKDGLRHIHPDPEQARTITVREAARLQTFPDDYYFNCSQTDKSCVVLISTNRVRNRFNKSY